MINKNKHNREKAKEALSADNRRDFIKKAGLGALGMGGMLFLPDEKVIAQNTKKTFKTGPKIKQINVTPIAFTDPPVLNAAGLHAPYALRNIVEVITDDNISGISEMHGGIANTNALEAAKGLLIGKDPFQLNEIKRTLQTHFGKEEAQKRGDAAYWNNGQLSTVFGAVEVACLDIMGKITGRPVVDLLGGKMREQVPFAAYLFYKYEGAGGKLGFKTDNNAKGWAAVRQAKALDPAGIVAEAKGMCEEFGFKSIKLKGGVFEPQKEVDAMFALREAFGPDVPLRVDPNALWKVETGIKYGKMMDGLLEYLEDPVRSQENMAKVRKEIKTPLATNMCTTAFEHIPSSIALGSEDIILTDHHYWGGLKASMDVGRICEVFGRGISMHSNSHLGISLAAMVHLGGALPYLTTALDTHYPWQSEEVITGGRLKFEEGSVQVPQGPGLGVELDKKALALLHKNYLDSGLTKRDDAKEMQKVQPGWVFKNDRW